MFVEYPCLHITRGVIIPSSDITLPGIYLKGNESDNTDMKSAEQNRRENLAVLSTKHGGPTALSAIVGKSQPQMSSWIAGRKTISPATARLFENKLHLPLNWMDQDHSAIDAEYRVLAGGASPDVVALPSPEATRDLIPQARALVEQIITKSKENKLSEGDIALLISTVTRLSGEK